MGCCVSDFPDDNSVTYEDMNEIETSSSRKQSIVLDDVVVSLQERIKQLTTETKELRALCIAIQNECEELIDTLAFRDAKQARLRDRSFERSELKQLRSTSLKASVWTLPSDDPRMILKALQDRVRDLAALKMQLLVNKDRGERLHNALDRECSGSVESMHTALSTSPRRMSVPVARQPSPVAKSSSTNTPTQPDILDDLDF
eukprot:Sspe_Gene.116008::Locus_104264_Transcript_1_1_Confidence_1.000_Length_746::g.116008::m.116008